MNNIEYYIDFTLELRSSIKRIYNKVVNETGINSNTSYRYFYNHF